MTTTVLALFRNRRNAEAAIRALHEAHVDTAQLGLVETGDDRPPRFDRAAIAGVVGGAVGCGVVGVMVGFIAGGFVPLIQPWIAGGWWVPLMVGLAGAATGAGASLLMSHSAPYRGAAFDEADVEAGRTLVSVHADPTEVQHVRQILLDEGAFDASPIEAPIRRRGFAG